jgi:hypothetical protein
MSDFKYQAGGTPYHYPEAGDPKPISGAKVQLLTIGGVHTSGPWKDTGFYLGWLELPKRDMAKEDLIQAKRKEARDAAARNKG